MSIWFWKVLDNPVVEACFGPALALGALVVGSVVFPAESVLESACEFFAFWTTLILISRFVGATWRATTKRTPLG